MTNEIDNEALSKIFAAKDTDALATQYEKWAEDYDSENAAAGFRLPALATGFVARYVPITDKPILDAGCGTGLVGDNLHVLGYRNLVGIDLSPEMLKCANRLSIYEHLELMVLGEHLNFSDNQFIAIISTGVFTEGHAPFSSFNELIRITESGGHLVFNVRDDIYENHGFRQKQESLEKDGLWKLVERSDRFRPFTIKEPNVIARLFVYQVV